MKDLFDKQGHRGCRGLMPENTWPAMKLALDLGVTTLEMDVVFTKNKEAVLSHEPWFGHEITTKPDGTYMGEREERKFNIYWMTYEDVKTFDVGMKPHPRFPNQQKMKAVKPLLKDIIDSVKQYMKTSKRPFPYFNIETKCLPMGDKVFHPEPAEFVELLMAVLKGAAIEDYVIIQSFDFRTLQYLHEHYQGMKTAMLIEDYDKRGLDEQIKALGFNPTIYSPAFELVDESLIKKCHKQQIKVIPWTVNDKKEIDRLKKMGVDGIISDFPDLFNE
ncbi:MAG TPA: glycerophosphodiester phosphodiesterase [Chitinophagaceae bacterium]|nr:glycerophosphodiester phosphodiesterase [Chitinophagaceae bacterium]